MLIDILPAFAHCPIPELFPHLKNLLQRYLTLDTNIYMFSIAAITNYHTLNGLEQHMYYLTVL